jgi:hypothetical protein
MEDGGRDDEETEDDDLHDETGDDDVVSHVAVVGSICGSKKAGTCVVVLAFVQTYLEWSMQNAYQKIASKTRVRHRRQTAS